MYPTEEQLKVIKEWDLVEKPVKSLLDYIEPIWEYGDWGFTRTKHKLELHTGGWSGNEDIISSLQQNIMFWTLYWKDSRRGGRFVFDDSMVSKELKGFI